MLSLALSLFTINLIIIVSVLVIITIVALYAFGGRNNCNKYKLTLISKNKYYSTLNDENVIDNLYQLKKHLDNVYYGWVFVYKDRAIKYPESNSGTLSHDFLLETIYRYIPNIFNHKVYTLDITAVDTDRDYCRVISIAVINNDTGDTVGSIDISDDLNILIR